MSVALAPDMNVRGHRVDRIDSRGNIREHLIERGAESTLCGLVIGASNTQEPLGNGLCKRCERLARGRLWAKGGTP